VTGAERDPDDDVADDDVADDDVPDDDGPFSFTLTDEDAGGRLDRVIADRHGVWSRSAIQRWMDDGRVRVDGVPVGRRPKLAPGALVEVRPAPPPPSAATPQPIPLSILFEDAHLLVVDKPAGLVVHPAPGHPDGTLVNAVLHHTPVEGSASGARASGTPAPPPRPGIVHRLDKDTSGVLVVAKTGVARDRLVATFQAHDLDRRYLALAVGAPPDRITYDTLHGRHPRDRKRFTSHPLRGGRRAVTHVETRERFGDRAALVQCTLETGRTHQIRVHLAEHGHPLVGDPVYGGRPRDPRVRQAAAHLGRQALHATLLAFAHPITGEPLRFETPPPGDFTVAGEMLRSG